jgi:tetratricopeptide (TPR) repeat protein
MFRFQQIENLYTLAAVPVLIFLFILLLRWKKKAMKRIGDEHLVKQLISNYSPKLFAFKFVLIVMALVLSAFALADLAKPEANSNIKLKGIDVMIALDVSNSMLADDIKPNRLERAKQVVSRLIDKLGDNRVGLVIFAGKAYLQMPLTIDHSAAKMYLASASPDDVPTQGTVISDALKMCYSSFNTEEKKYRSVILITDGEDHDEDAISVTKKMVDAGVITNTVGLGSAQGVMLRDPKTGDYKKDEDGNPVVTSLNEDELKQIAQNGQGTYQHMSNADEVADNLQRKLSGVEEKGTSTNSLTVYKHYFWIFLLAAFIFLIIESVTPEIKRKAKIPALFFLFLLFSTLSYSQDVNKDIIKGNDAYKKNDYNSAAQAYKSALNKSSQNPIASYNLGNSLYKNDKSEDAISSYDNTIRNAGNIPLKQKSYYNKGVAFQKQNKLPECITAYKSALKIDPNDEDARQNLERALKQQQQQQQKNDDQKKKDQKQNDDQKKQDQKQPQQQPKMSKEDAEEKLKTLMEQEKNLQDKLRKVRATAPNKPKKDW